MKSLYKILDEASQFHQRFESVKDDYSRNLELGTNTNTTRVVVPSLGMNANVSNNNTSEGQRVYNVDPRVSGMPSMPK